jgi:hypothetical protein
MEKLYKYGTNEKMQDLFKKYDRDNFTLKGYEFIRNFIKNYVSKFDVIQLCCMFTEEKFIDVLGEEKTTLNRQNELLKNFRKENKNTRIKVLTDTVIYWSTEDMKILKELNKNN